MCIHIYIYIYMYMYVCIYIYIYIYIYSMCTHVCYVPLAFLQTGYPGLSSGSGGGPISSAMIACRLYLSIYIYIYIYIYIHTYNTYIHISIYVYTHMYIYIYIYVYRLPSKPGNRAGSQRRQAAHGAPLRVPKVAVLLLSLLLL